MLIIRSLIVLIVLIIFSSCLISCQTDGVNSEEAASSDSQDLYIPLMFPYNMDDSKEFGFKLKNILIENYECLPTEGKEYIFYDSTMVFTKSDTIIKFWYRENATQVEGSFIIPRVKEARIYALGLDRKEKKISGVIQPFLVYQPIRHGKWIYKDSLVTKEVIYNTKVLYDNSEFECSSSEKEICLNLNQKIDDLTGLPTSISDMRNIIFCIENEKILKYGNATLDMKLSKKNELDFTYINDEEQIEGHFFLPPYKNTTYQRTYDPETFQVSILRPYSFYEPIRIGKWKFKDKEGITKTFNYKYEIDLSRLNTWCVK